MDIRPLTPHYAVSAQICVDDLAKVADAGIKTVICNRPDSEIPAELHHARIRTAAEAVGLNFVVLELTMQTLTPANIARQHALIEKSDGPVLAYCRTGTRCSVVWALTQAGDMATDAILAAATTAGYDLSGLAPTLDQMAKTQG
ncbi:MAG: TIGR01244 family sulfur transferase [Rhodobacteraceae bacterium]|nr:TIGR01244 family sulfur transferase [Paracoccaceae bacterium]